MSLFESINQEIGQEIRQQIGQEIRQQIGQAPTRHLSASKKELLHLKDAHSSRLV